MLVNAINWKEYILIAGALVLLVGLYYLINRKQIAKEERLRKQIKEFGYPTPTFQNEVIENQIEKRKSSPQILSAYERMTILLDRIDTNKLASRVHPISNEKKDYANFLIQHVEQEYDFNVSQQLYLTDESWALILTAKNTIIQNILKTSLEKDVVTAVDLRNRLVVLKEEQSLIELAKSRLRKEVAELI